MARYIEHTTFDKFEDNYIRIRKKENRLHDLSVIKQLPFLKDEQNPHYKEWAFRADTFKRFQSYFEHQNITSLLDVGCGNGWLIHQLFDSEIQFMGIEVNKTEIMQAKQLFEKQDNIDLILGDIFTLNIDNRFDIITISGAIQYFQSFEKITKRLISLLNKGGTLHIMDSPFYHNEASLNKAKLNSQKYYSSLDSVEMSSFYFHHSLNDLKIFNYDIFYNPNKLSNKILRKLGVSKSPFPWILIKN